MLSTNTLKSALIVSLTTLLLIGCLNQEEAKNQPQERKAGADRDAHGCIGSAGYLWCAKENKCARPWELAKDKGFENTESDFKQHCDNP